MRKTIATVIILGLVWIGYVAWPIYDPPENIEDNDKAVALIRTLFLQHNVVCYVLTLGAASKGKQYVLFSAEDKSGTMVVGHREIIMQPALHLGPLEIIESNFAEGRFVGLLPRQATPVQ
jgi:hypothetical protein